MNRKLPILHINIEGVFEALHTPYFSGIIQPHTIWSFLNYLFNFDKLKKGIQLQTEDMFDGSFLYLTSDEEILQNLGRKSSENLSNNKININIGDMIYQQKGKMGTGLLADKIKQKIDIFVFSGNKTKQYENLLENIISEKISIYNIKFAGKSFPKINLNLKILTEAEIKTKTKNMKNMNEISNFVKYLIKYHGKKKILFKMPIIDKKYKIDNFFDTLIKNKKELKKYNAKIYPILNGYQINKIIDNFVVADHLIDLCFIKRIRQIAINNQELISYQNIFPLFKLENNNDNILYFKFLKLNV